MPDKALISICIPAFKRTDFLQRLLDSIAMQTFRDFEVIVTDDSPDLAVKTLCEQYKERLPLSYFRNERPLGTPENWNEAVRRANGEWIKIMHDDDWLAGKDSLACFAEAIGNGRGGAAAGNERGVSAVRGASAAGNVREAAISDEREASVAGNEPGAGGEPGVSFIFSAYRDIFLNENRQREMFVSSFRYKAFLQNRATLFSRNIVGPPSVVMYKKDRAVVFDGRVKWVVDIDFYIRYLEGRKPAYIDKVLVNVGLGEEQVTRDCFRQRPVEIPENFYLLNKIGPGCLKNILVYDAWWRLMRNLEIDSREDITGAGYTGPIPAVILSMVRWQHKMSRRLLGVGIVSKTLMFLHYISHYNRIPA
jgi:glycosyltransferase involved in cell wall biosynthesis